MIAPGAQNAGHKTAVVITTEHAAEVSVLTHGLAIEIVSHATANPRQIAGG